MRLKTTHTKHTHTHTHTKAHMANIPTIIVKLARIKATLPTNNTMIMTIEANQTQLQ